MPREIDVAPESSHKIASLFRGGLARDTVLLWVSFFFGLMVNYVVVLLLPALLTSTDIGFGQAAASRALAMSNYGGVAGALLGAVVLQRLGSRIAMLAMAAGGVVCGGILAGWPLDPAATTGFMAMLLLTGGLLNGVQTTMYALAAHVYPTPIRSTGVGTAVAFGRIGNVVAAYAGSVAIDRGGSSAYFALWSGLMLAVLLALACIRRHVQERHHKYFRLFGLNSHSVFSTYVAGPIGGSCQSRATMSGAITEAQKRRRRCPDGVRPTPLGASSLTRR